MAMARVISLLVLVPLVAGHFEPLYPGWRADSFLEPYSQYEYPCAGVEVTQNRTDWPLDGGSIKVNYHHPWTYVFMNLGIGNNVTNFNITLNENGLYNQTGEGTLCMERFPLPPDLDIVDGTNATLQFVTSGDSGSALYNCADITFRSNAALLDGDQCVNSTGVSVVRVGESTTSDAGSSSSPTSRANKADVAGMIVLLAAGVVGSLLA